MPNYFYIYVASEAPLDVSITNIVVTHGGVTEDVSALAYGTLESYSNPAVSISDDGSGVWNASLSAAGYHFISVASNRPMEGLEIPLGPVTAFRFDIKCGTPGGAPVDYWGAYVTDSDLVTISEFSEEPGVLSDTYRTINLNFGNAGQGASQDVGLLPALTGVGYDRAFAGASSTLPAIQVQITPGEDSDNSGYLLSRATAGDNFISTMDLDALMSAEGTLASSISVAVLRDASVDSTGSVGSTFTLDGLIDVVVLETLNARALLNAPAVSPVAWAVNLDTGASSMYEGFGFNSFAEFGGRYFGARGDGVYLLEGDSDNGQPTQASVSFGKQTFGTSALKRVACAYLGLTAEGQMVLRVRTDENDYLYAAQGTAEAAKVQRIDVGRGLRANYFEFELFNSDGCQFDLDSIEFVPVALTRRV